MHTIAGNGVSKVTVVIQDMHLPEFDKSWLVHQQTALLFDHDCRYDVILGSDFLAKTGIDIKYSTGTIIWFENELPMCNPLQMTEKEFSAMAEMAGNG